MLQKLSVNIIKVIYIGLMRDVFTQYLKTSRRMAANWKREELGKMMSRTPTQFGHLRLCSTWKIIIVMTASCDSTGGKANGGTLMCEMYLQLCVHFEAEVTITSDNKPWCFWWCFCESLLFQNKIHIPGRGAFCKTHQLFTKSIHYLICLDTIIQSHQGELVSTYRLPVHCIII